MTTPPSVTIFVPTRSGLLALTCPRKVSTSMFRSKRISIRPPVVALRPYNLAGRTWVLLSTRTSPARNKCLISANCPSIRSPSHGICRSRQAVRSDRGDCAIRSCGRWKSKLLGSTSYCQSCSAEYRRTGRMPMGRYSPHRCCFRCHTT